MVNPIRVWVMIRVSVRCFVVNRGHKGVCTAALRKKDVEE